jgi:hypothetical protein
MVEVLAGREDLARPKDYITSKSVDQIFPMEAREAWEIIYFEEGLDA